MVNDKTNTRIITRTSLRIAAIAIGTKDEKVVFTLIGCKDKVFLYKLYAFTVSDVATCRHIRYSLKKLKSRILLIRSRSPVSMVVLFIIQ